VIEDGHGGDGVVRVVATGQRVGVASRELMVPGNLRDQSLEAEIRSA